MGCIFISISFSIQLRLHLYLTYVRTPTHRNRWGFAPRAMGANELARVVLLALTPHTRIISRTHTSTVVGVIPFGSRFPAFSITVCEQERVALSREQRLRWPWGGGASIKATDRQQIFCNNTHSHTLPAPGGGERLG